MNPERIAELRALLASPISKGAASLEVAREALDALDAWNGRLDEHGDIRLLKYEGTETTLSGTMVAPFFHDLAAGLHEQFVASGGMNYVSYELTHRPESAPSVTYEILMQRKGGEAPANQNERLRRGIKPMRDLLMRIGMTPLPEDLTARLPSVQKAFDEALALAQQSSKDFDREIGMEPVPRNPLAVSALLGALYVLSPETSGRKITPEEFGVLEEISEVLFDMVGRIVRPQDVAPDPEGGWWLKPGEEIGGV